MRQFKIHSAFNPFQSLSRNRSLGLESLESRQLLATLQAGDANLDLHFDESDFILAGKGGKYETDEHATWAEGDWNGAPGGNESDPPPGDGIYTSSDLVATFMAGVYLAGSYDPAAGEPVHSREPISAEGPTDVKLTYDTLTGELLAEPNKIMTTFHLVSETGIFNGTRPVVFDGLYDVASPNSLFHFYPTGRGALYLGSVLPTGLSVDVLLTDLTVDGSRLEGGGIGNVTLTVCSDCVDPNNVVNPPTTPEGAVQLSVLDQNVVQGEISSPGEEDVYEFRANWLGTYHIAPRGDVPTNVTLTDSNGNVVMPIPGDTVNIGFETIPGETYFVHQTAKDPNQTGRYTSYHSVRWAAEPNQFGFDIHDDEIGLWASDLDQDEYFNPVQVSSYIDTAGDIDVFAVRTFGQNEFSVSVDEGFDVALVGNDGLTKTPIRVEGATDIYAVKGFAKIYVVVSAALPDQTGEYQLTTRPSPGGDFNVDNVIDVVDVERLIAGIQTGRYSAYRDLNADSVVDYNDLKYMIEVIVQTSIADVNLDGRFDSSDLTSVFQKGEYEDGIAGNSNWLAGDWNFDGEFDTQDLVTAFKEGKFLRTAVAGDTLNDIALATLMVDARDDEELGGKANKVKNAFVA